MCPAVAGSRLCGRIQKSEIAPRLRDPACAGEFGRRKLYPAETLGGLFSMSRSDRGVRVRLGKQGIRPFEIGKAGKIGIGGAESVSPFDGEGGEVGVGG